MYIVYKVCFKCLAHFESKKGLVYLVTVQPTIESEENAYILKIWDAEAAVSEQG